MVPTVGGTFRGSSVRERSTVRSGLEAVESTGAFERDRGPAGDRSIIGFGVTGVTGGTQLITTSTLLTFTKQAAGS